MTMQQQATAPISKGWDYWFLQCTDQEKEQIIVDHAKKTAALFKQLRDLLRERVAGRDLPPAERLLAHTERPAQRWEMFRQLLPKDYDEAMKDYHKLLERAHTDADFAQRVEELAAEEARKRAAMAQAQALAGGVAA